MTKKSTIDKLPNSITIHDYYQAALGQAVVLLRMGGYVFHPTSAPEVFAATGEIRFTLVPGQPSKESMDAVAQLLKVATERDAEQYRQDVLSAAKQMIEDKERAEKQRLLEIDLAEKKRVIAELEAQLHQ